DPGWRRHTRPRRVTFRPAAGGGRGGGRVRNGGGGRRVRRRPLGRSTGRCDTPCRTRPRCRRPCRSARWYVGPRWSSFQTDKCGGGLGAVGEGLDEGVDELGVVAAMAAKGAPMLQA